LKKISTQLLKTLCVNGIGLIVGVFSANYYVSSEAANFLLFFMLHQVITSVSISGAVNYTIKLSSQEKININDFKYVQKLAFVTCLCLSVIFSVIYFFQAGMTLNGEMSHLFGWLILAFVMTSLNINYSFYQGLGSDSKGLLYSFCIFCTFCLTVLLTYVFSLQIKLAILLILIFSSMVLYSSTKDICSYIALLNHGNLNSTKFVVFKLRDYIINFVSNSVVLPVFFILGYAISLYGALDDSLAYNVTVQLRNLILLLPVVVLQYSITQKKITENYFSFFSLFFLVMIFVVLISFYFIKIVAPFLYNGVFDENFLYLKYMCITSFFAAISSCLGNYIFIKGNYRFCLFLNIFWAMTVVFSFFLDSKFNTISAYTSLIYGYISSIFISSAYFFKAFINKSKVREDG
jgi:hypothetical protein